MEKTKRFVDDGATIFNYLEPGVLVYCPRCRDRAIATPTSERDAEARLVCASCGLAKSSGPICSWTFGSPVDPWFSQALWLQSDFRGHVVWAFNAVHLYQLRGFVAASHRLRADLRPWGSHRLGNESMVEKLPRWFVEAKNREGLTRVLDDLLERSR